MEKAVNRQEMKKLRTVCWPYWKNHQCFLTLKMVSVFLVFSRKNTFRCFFVKTPQKTLTILSVKKHWGFFIWAWTILHFSSHFACFVFSFWDVSNIFVDRNFASWRIDSHDESHLLYESFNLKVTSEMKMKIKNENFA